MKIDIKYYASLREQADKNFETIDTDAKTPKDLYSKLQEKYNFSFCASQLKVAINSNFDSFDNLLKEGDTIVFIPPVAGG